MEAEVFGAGHAGGADIAGVAAEGGEADRRPFGEKGEGTFPDFGADPLQEPSADWVALSTEGHGAAEEDDRGVEGVEEGGDADAEPASHRIDQLERHRIAGFGQFPDQLRINSTPSATACAKPAAVPASSRSRAIATSDLALA